MVAPMGNSPGSHSSENCSLQGASAELEGSVNTCSHNIADLLPHSGAMCLLNAIASWNETDITCFAESHRSDTNPLRHGDVLPIHAGIEYVAQAMAIHGTLCEQRAGRPRIGYLAVLSNVDWFVPRLDDLPGKLEAQAEKLMATESGFNYAFRLLHESRTLLEGQAVIALQDAAR